MAPRPPTPTPTPPSVDALARAMEMLAAAMQQQATYPQWRPTIASSSAGYHQSEQMGLTEFMRHNPPRFGGDLGPDAAEKWLREVEKIFEATLCPEDRKLTFGKYLLVDEAEFWWSGTQRMMIARGEVCNWETFRERFLEKYFPDSVRFQKETEFLSLRQGNMTVHDYAIRFEHLSRFYIGTSS